MTRHVHGRALVLVVAGVLAAASATISQEPPATDRAVDRNEIAAILARWQEAWNQHDMHAFASQFYEDAVWVLWTGEVWKGRKAIEQGHAAVHKTVFHASTQRA